MAECQKDLMQQGKPYPRTCAKCGLGPCKVYGAGGLKMSDADDNLRDRVEGVAHQAYAQLRGSCRTQLTDALLMAWEDLEEDRKNVIMHVAMAVARDIRNRV